MITLEVLNDRKQTILGDIEKVEVAIKQLDDQRVSLQANLFALQGAAQQVDFFINTEETEEAPITSTSADMPEVPEEGVKKHD